MKRIYRVEFEEKWTGCSEWLSDHVNVLANGNAQDAIEKVKRHRLGQITKDGPNKSIKCVGFRFTGVKVEAEADI
jgi:hypothetical protein